MLVTLCDYKQNVTLIENSGIQFLDFGVTPQDTPHGGRFVRKTANGPLLRLDYDEAQQKYTLPSDGGPELVKPENVCSMAQSLALLDGVWLPFPLLRVNAPRAFVGGPDNWARIQINRLDIPDESGYTHRVTVAIDTRLMDDSDSLLAPGPRDVSNGSRFAVAWRDEDVGDFLDQTWVDGWLREIFTQYVSRHEARTEEDIARALKFFEYQAHWLNVMSLIGTQVRVPDVRLVAAETNAIAIDLTLDVGNTHTCGVLIENDIHAEDGLSRTTALRVRSLSEPYRLSAPLFSSRVEFSQANFGKQAFSVESGREDAFIWPSLVRVGDEASWLAARRQGNEGSSGLSSPRRYLWDDAPAIADWRFNHPEREAPATARPLMLLINDEGEPLYRIPPALRLPVFNPRYSRSSLMTHMLCELLAQIISQMNSVAHRLQMGDINAPRYLRSLILTLPCAMPKQERDIFRLRMQEAIALVWKANGWHPQDADFTGAAGLAQSKVPVPEIKMEWDEASCGQLVWLYNEAMVTYAGQPARLFADLARTDAVPDAAEVAGRSLRVASLDIGGGTMDLAITRYSLETGGSGAKIRPELLFREGFKVAGDDILLEVIQRAVLPAIERALHNAGVSDTAALMMALFGDAGRMTSQSVLRQQLTLQLLIPAGLGVLRAWEQSNPADASDGLHTHLGALLTHPLTGCVQEYLQQVIRPALSDDAIRFDILATPLQVDFSALNQAVQEERFCINQPLHAMCEAISYYDCDILLVTGRPAGLPGVKLLLNQLQPVPASRIRWMNHYQPGEWYPLRDKGRIGNAKSTAAVGAALCCLALDLRLPRFNLKAADIGAYSTVRHLGELDAQENRLSEENIWYRDIDLDDPEAQLDAELTFPLRGGVTLGFRQLDNPRWPATPLYTLGIRSPELARTLAGDGVLNVRLKLVHAQGEEEACTFELAEAALQTGERVGLDALALKLNTLADRRINGQHYWIDSGSVYLK